MNIFSIINTIFLLFFSSTIISFAKEFPNKPMTYIVTFDAGGESDTYAKNQQKEWKKVTGQTIKIKHISGRGGAKAWAQLNFLPADGYTIMGINLPHIILQPISGDVGYKTEDLTPIHYFNYTPNAIFVRKTSKFKTLKELIEYAKKNPGIVNFAGSGKNSANHLALTRFNKLAGVNTTYVPFAGTGLAITAIIGGQTIAGFNYASSALKSGNMMRMLAIASEKRMPAFPNVPTFKELGYDLVGGAYRGISVPKSTPEEIREKISNIVSKINKQAEFAKRMEAAGFILTDITYDKMDDFVNEKTEEYIQGAKVLGILK